MRSAIKRRRSSRRRARRPPGAVRGLGGGSCPCPGTDSTAPPGRVLLSSKRHKRNGAHLGSKGIPWQVLCGVNGCAHRGPRLIIHQLAAPPQQRKALLEKPSDGAARTALAISRIASAQRCLLAARRASESCTAAARSAGWRSAASASHSAASAGAPESNAALACYRGPFSRPPISPWSFCTLHHLPIQASGQDACQHPASTRSGR